MLERPGPRIVAVNAELCRLTGYVREELIGRTPRLFQGPLTDRATLDRLRADCAAGKTFTGEAINYRKNGATYLLQWSISPLHDATGAITHFLAVQRELSPPEARQHPPGGDHAREALTHLTAQTADLADALLARAAATDNVAASDLQQLQSRVDNALRELRRLVQ